MLSIGSVVVTLLRGLVWQYDTDIEHFGSHVADVDEGISTLESFGVRFYCIGSEFCRVELLVLSEGRLRL